MELNLETKEKNFFELPENYPNLIHASKAKEHLLFIHEPTSLGKNGISVVSLKDKTTYFFDVNDILKTNDIDDAKILSINTTPQNKLLIMTKTSIIVWDMINNELLSITKEELSNGIYIWAK